MFTNRITRAAMTLALSTLCLVAMVADASAGPLLLALPAIASMAGTATAAAGGLGTIGTIAGIGGTILGAGSALMQGERARKAGKYEAAQLQQRANEEMAVGQKKMFAAEQQKENALSALAARSAASSGDTTDAGVLELGGGIENRGEAQALMEFYRGQTASDRSNDAAGAAIYKGKAAQHASYFKAAGTILDGFSSFGKKYGSKLPSGEGGVADGPLMMSSASGYYR